MYLYIISIDGHEHVCLLSVIMIIQKSKNKIQQRKRNSIDVNKRNLIPVWSPED